MGRDWGNPATWGIERIAERKTAPASFKPDKASVDRVFRLCQVGLARILEYLYDLAIEIKTRKFIMLLHQIQI